MTGTARGRTVVLGSRGMLGRAWVELLDSLSLPHGTLDRPDLDLADPRTIRDAIGSDIGCVVNCAAYTDVDGAEQEPARATRINATGVGTLAQRCAEVGCLLVHYSTDYVFDGLASSPYAVDEPRAPLNAYGRSKARGELLLQQSGCAHLLIRTSWLYAPWGKNFVRTIMDLSARNESLRVVADQSGRPTSAQHLARSSHALLHSGCRGTYHVTDGGACSWYEFARAIVEITGNPCRVDPCSSEEFPRPAPRPHFSVLDLTRTEAALGPMRHYRDNLADVLEAIRASATR